MFNEEEIIRCPFCGTENENHLIDLTNEIFEERCEHCGEMFYVQIEIHYSYKTAKNPSEFLN